MSVYTQLSESLDKSLDVVLNSIPKTFTTKQFIDAVMNSFPVECGKILSQRTPRSFHSWISRWYLSRQPDIVKAGVRKIETLNGDKSDNALWSNLKK